MATSATENTANQMFTPVTITIIKIAIGQKL